MLRFVLGNAVHFRQTASHPRRSLISAGKFFSGTRLLPSSRFEHLRFASTRKTPLREDIWTFPNVLTMTRLVAAPCVGYLVVQHSYGAALGLMIYASVTDFVDGYLARKYHNQTYFGSIADPAADKALLVTLAACLTVSGAVPWWCGGAILARDLALATAAFFIRWVTLPAPRTLERYFDLGIPSVKVTPTRISKWNTFFQMTYLSLCLANPVFSFMGPDAAWMLAVPVTITTVWSGISYIFSKTAVKKI